MGRRGSQEKNKEEERDKEREKATWKEKEDGDGAGLTQDEWPRKRKGKTRAKTRGSRGRRRRELLPPCLWRRRDLLALALDKGKQGKELFPFSSKDKGKQGKEKKGTEEGAKEVGKSGGGDGDERFGQFKNKGARCEVYSAGEWWDAKVR
jgi:hypothetical protein